MAFSLDIFPCYEWCMVHKFCFVPFFSLTSDNIGKFDDNIDVNLVAVYILKQKAVSDKLHKLSRKTHCTKIVKSNPYYLLTQLPPNNIPSDHFNE